MREVVSDQLKVFFAFAFRVNVTGILDQEVASFKLGVLLS